MLSDNKFEFDDFAAVLYHPRVILIPVRHYNHKVDCILLYFNDIGLFPFLVKVNYR